MRYAINGLYINSMLNEEQVYVLGDWIGSYYDNEFGWRVFASKESIYETEAEAIQGLLPKLELNATIYRNRLDELFGKKEEFDLDFIPGIDLVSDEEPAPETEAISA